MAGLGFDAAIMRDAPEGLKKAVGWPAYVVSAGKHLRGRGIRVTITLDGGRRCTAGCAPWSSATSASCRATSRCCPTRKPDDGILDVVVIATRNVVDWARVDRSRRAARRRPDRRMERFTGKHVLIEASHPQPRQLDGDVIEDGRTMDIPIEPGALKVRVARGGRADVVGEPGAADPHHARRRAVRGRRPHDVAALRAARSW